MTNTIMSEDAQVTRGRDAQRNNILAARLVAEAVRTTLGPKGMDKMVVDGSGDVVVTNDGVTILDEMQIEHPTAKMIVQIAKTQEDEVGDGTTTAVILAGELMKGAEHLLDQRIHPTIIARGYLKAAARAKEISASLARDISPGDVEMLKKVCATAITGKGPEVAKDVLVDLCVEAVRQVQTDAGIDVDNIKVEKQVGTSIDQSTLIKGLVLDKERVHNAMPQSVELPKILLVDCPIEVRDTEIDAKIQINDPMQMSQFLDQEERMIRTLVDRILSSGATSVFCQKGIADLAQFLLAKAGVFAVRRVKKSDMDKLAKATGANVLSSLDDIPLGDLGTAGKVYEEKVGKELMTFVVACPNPKAVTLLVRGGTEHVVNEVARAVDDALGVLTCVLKDRKIVSGAGSFELALARQIRAYATTLSGREQLAVNVFADALEIIPTTLAENAGLDPIDMLTTLKAQHDAGQQHAGVDAFAGTPVDALEAGIVEPLRVKIQALQSATEVAIMILRIDDIIAGSPSKELPGNPPPM